jgi:hypothetical protein
MALQFYTQMFAILTIMFFALTDLVLCVAKKARFRCVISYLVALALVIPALVFTMKYSTIDMSSFWPDTPGNPIIALGKVAYYFLGNPITGLLFLLSAIGIIISFFVKIKKFNFDNFDCILFFTLSGVWVLGITYVYSQFINPAGSLWVYRYFDGVWPQVYIITAFGGITAVNFVIKRTKLSKKLAIIGVCLFLGIGASYSIIMAVRGQLSAGEAYREVAETIAQDSNAYRNDAIVLADTDPEPWIDYYFDKAGLQVPLNIRATKTAQTTQYDQLMAENLSSLDKILTFGRVYVCNMHGKFDEAVLLRLQQEYNLESTYTVKLNGLRNHGEVTKMWVFSKP